MNVLLDDRVSILKRSTTADGQGGRTTSWVDLVTESTTALTRLFAHILPLDVSERIQAAAVGSHMAYTVTMNYRADITAKMRVQWTPYKSTTAKTLEIHGVNAKDGGRTWLVLDCAEVV
jgi:SPP1 family predicted phage head-tail adaptor